MFTELFRTNEGAVQNAHTLDNHLEFYSKAGSLFTKRKNYYNNSESALLLFQRMWGVDAHQKTYTSGTGADQFRKLQLRFGVFPTKCLPARRP